MKFYKYPAQSDSEDEFGQYQPPTEKTVTPLPTVQAKSSLPLLALLGVGLLAGYYIYKNSSRDKLHGGVGDQFEPEDFDPDDLEEGSDVEMEHTDDPEIAEEIAMDHLTEDSDYYRKLASVMPEHKKSFVYRKETEKKKQDEIAKHPYSLFKSNPFDGENEDDNDEECEHEYDFSLKGE